MLPSVLLTTLEPDPALLEEEVQQVKLGWMISRAKVVICPIWEGGHWTLLVLNNTLPGAANPAASQLPAATPEPVVGDTGCGTCHGKGCALCHFPKMEVYVQRNDEEKALFDAKNWPYQEGGTWSAKYFDPLPVASTCSRQAASRILKCFEALGWPQEVPAVEPGQKQQTPGPCGLYCLHWAEAELRQIRGEGPSLSLTTLARSACRPCRTG